MTDPQHLAQEAERDPTQPKVVNAVTLELSPEDAEKLDLARSVGSLSLVLRTVGCSLLDDLLIVTSLIMAGRLIGDRAGLDDAVVRRLQEAGTFHVIAISGGNIAVLAAQAALGHPDGRQVQPEPHVAGQAHPAGVRPALPVAHQRIRHAGQLAQGRQQRLIERRDAVGKERFRNALAGDFSVHKTEQAQAPSPKPDFAFIHFRK